MAKQTIAKPKPQKQTVFVLAGLLAWLIPGAGHCYLGRWTRGIILFITIHALFWTGMAVGGVFAVNPQDEPWWFRAQMGTGASGLFRWTQQRYWYNSVLNEARHELPADTRLNAAQRELARQHAVDAVLAEKDVALAPPASDVAYVFSGVAGMLNIMCIFDAVMLSLMGRFGETPPTRPKQEAPSP